MTTYLYRSLHSAHVRNHLKKKTIISKLFDFKHKLTDIYSSHSAENNKNRFTIEKFNISRYQLGSFKISK